MGDAFSCDWSTTIAGSCHFIKKKKKKKLSNLIQKSGCFEAGEQGSTLR
jgi:hypothetical protein